MNAELRYEGEQQAEQSDQKHGESQLLNDVWILCAVKEVKVESVEENTHRHWNDALLSIVEMNTTDKPNSFECRQKK